MDVFISTESGEERAMTSSAADLLSCSDRDGGRNSGPRDQCTLVFASKFSPLETMPRMGRILCRILPG